MFKNKLFCLMCFFLFFVQSDILYSAPFVQEGLSRTPLLLKGKSSLYQRVISHPGAMLSNKPGVAGTQPVRAFTPFYVYAREQAGGREWLEVSAASSGAERSGWLPKEACSPWDKALTLMFADRMGRYPALFFRRFSDLNALASSENMSGTIDRLIKNAKSPDSPLLAIEPENASIPRKHFYLMPVFNYSDEYEHYNLRLLNAGIIDPGRGTTQQRYAPNSRFAAGMAFIVDTTISMGPYIAQTKKFIHEAYDTLAKSPIGQDVSFAVVAYRNSTRYNPQIHYISTVISPFCSVQERAEAEAKINNLDEATVSTHAFNEDAFAGIKTALDQLDWSPFAVKLAVMITDAGAIRNNDPFASTGLNEREMADLLAQKGIRLVVIHLQTAAGKRHNMPDVINQYKQLTAIRDGNVKSAYIALPVKDPQSASLQFRRIAKALSDVLQKIVASAAGSSNVTKTFKARNEADPELDAVSIGERLGYAAWLEFAGQRSQITAPQLVEAWVADKDLENLSKGKSTDALIPCVLLNKRQLDTLARQIGMLVDAARASRATDSKGLFQRVISLSSQTLRDPERMIRKAGDNLCSQGLLPEFLEGLPYKSQVMNLTEQRWSAMSAREQDELIYSLEAKIRLYAEYHNDAGNWESFGASDPSEAVYRVPLTSLP